MRTVFPHRSTRRGLALALAAGLLAAGCSSEEAAEPVVPMVAASASNVFPLPPDSAFEPGPCPINPVERVEITIQCGTLRVLERRDQPDSGEVALAVMILQSPNPEKAPDPIVYLEGGPGGSAIVNQQVWLDPLTPLLDERDVILVDQRGTGFSEPNLACDSEFADASIFETGADLLRECMARLDAAGVDRSAYTTFENAADLKALREALGLETWNLYGVSYGTRLALAAMAIDPTGIRSTVLDSTVPLSVDLYTTLPENAQRSFLAVFAACEADPECNQAYPDLEERFYETIRRLNDEPAIVEGVHPVNGSTLRYGVSGDSLVDILFQSLYLPEVIPDVPEAVTAAYNGDNQKIWDLLIAPVFPDPVEVERYQEEALDIGRESFPSSITDGMHLSVQCTEEVPFTDYGEVREQAEELPREVSIALLGSVLSMEVQCDIWGVPERDIVELDAVLNASIPTLVLAGSFDPITPPEWGRIAADRLDNVTYLEIAGIGHAVIGGGECAGQIISSFIADPAAFDPNQCTIEPPDFVN